jgi:hypothetical protein
MKPSGTDSSQKSKPLSILVEPTCERCGRRTRFVGLESDPHNHQADLCTYECTGCGHLHVSSVPRGSEPGA